MPANHTSLLTSVVLAALLSACGGAPAAPSDPSSAGTDAEAVLTAKCGTCHAEPAADSQPTAAVEAELAEHADRVELTDAEKQALIEHLGS